MEQPIDRLAAGVSELKPGVTLSNPAAGWFIVGARIAPNVSIQCLFRKSPEPHYSVGLAFDDKARDVNEVNARRYQAFLQGHGCPENLQLFSPSADRPVLLYYRAVFPLDEAGSLERATKLAVWLNDQPFAQVE